ncbi:MAG: hypothetical protein ACFFD4_10830 [Candidatus Odinarchaeota archaeon]
MLKVRDFLSISLLLLLIGAYGPPVHSSVQNTAAWTWSTPKLVSDQSNHSSMDANVIVDSDFNIHVIWGERALYPSAGDDDEYIDILYQRWNLFSEEYYAPVLVSNTSTGDASNPHCAMDSSGNIHVIWEDSTIFFKDTADKDIMYRMWNASTEEWTFPRMISQGDYNSIDPVIAVSTSGEIHVFWTENSDPSEIYHRRYVDGAWQTIEEVTVEVDNFDAIWADVAIDNSNNIHLIWTDFSDYSGAGEWTGSIFYKKYDETLESWLATTYISTESTEDSFKSRIALDSSGIPHVVWIDKTGLPDADDGSFDVFYKTINPVTSTWTPTEVITVDSTLNCDLPCLAIDPLDNIHVVWTDQTNVGSSGSDNDIYYKYKNSTSGEWGPVTLLTSESAFHSTQPDIFCDKSGFLHLVWQDSMDIAGAGSDPDIFYKFLSGEPTTPTLSPIMQNTSNPGHLEIKWTDSFAATGYKIYRESALFTSTMGLSPIATVTKNEFIDSVTASGTYYYAVTAENAFGSSPLSNVESVVVSLSTTTTKTTTDSTSSSGNPTPGFSLLIFMIGFILLSRRKWRR